MMFMQDLKGENENDSEPLSTDDDLYSSIEDSSDTDEEYEFIEWTPQVNIFKEQFLTLNLIINKRQVIYHLLCVRMHLLYKMYL